MIFNVHKELDVGNESQENPVKNEQVSSPELAIGQFIEKHACAIKVELDYHSEKLGELEHQIYKAYRTQQTHEKQRMQVKRGLKILYGGSALWFVVGAFWMVPAWGFWATGMLGAGMGASIGLLSALVLRDHRKPKNTQGDSEAQLIQKVIKCQRAEWPAWGYNHKDSQSPLFFFWCMLQKCAINPQELMKVDAQGALSISIKTPFPIYVEKSRSLFEAMVQRFVGKDLRSAKVVTCTPKEFMKMVLLEQWCCFYDQPENVNSFESYQASGVDRGALDAQIDQIKSLLEKAVNGVEEDMASESNQQEAESDPTKDPVEVGERLYRNRAKERQIERVL